MQPTQSLPNPYPIPTPSRADPWMPVGQTGTMATGSQPDDSETLAHIRELVAAEKALREQLQHRKITESEEHQRLRRIEVELDQCWDLLRQRRALRETGRDPQQARVRPEDEVEGYLG